MSTRGRYGLRVMLELALRDGDDPVLMTDISARQHISRKYMHSLLSRLKGAGLVRALRGIGGGYLLNKSPEEINLFEILESLEGTLYPVECTTNPKVCQHVDTCIARDIWKDVDRALESCLSAITLSDLVARHRAKVSEAILYDI